MTYHLQTLAIICWLCISPSILYAEPRLPGFFKASYGLYVKNIEIGFMERHFFRQGERYIFQSKGNTTGIAKIIKDITIDEQTTWDFADQQFIPLQYHYSYSEREKEKKKIQIEFDQKNRKIINKIDQSHWTMPAKTDVLDKLLYQLKIMYDLQSAHQTIDYTIADGGKLKYYSVEILGEEKLSTKLGTFDALKIIHHKKHNKQKILVWVSKDLDYLPIKVQYKKEHGALMEARLNSIIWL